MARLVNELDQAWEEHRGIMLEWRGKRLEGMPSDLQRHLSKNFNLSKFSVALPRLIDYCRALGGTQELLAKEARKNGRED